MKKPFLAFIALALILILSSDSPANSAENKKRIAVIDTGIDITNTSISGSVVHEVCILDFALCPNGKRFMEGTGAATLDPVKSSKNGFYHGTQMSSVILNYNPDAEIVFVRVVAMTNSGHKASVSLNNLGYALEWIKNNASKYNISVVSASMGLPNKDGFCASNKLVENNIVTLKDMGIPAIFANGNNGKTNSVDFPACFEPTVAIGGADYISNNYYPSLYSNHSSATDFFAYGKLKVAMPNNTFGLSVGSSNSTALIASKWLYLSNNGLSYQEAYDRIKSASQTVTTKKVKNGIVVNHEVIK